MTAEHDSPESKAPAHAAGAFQHQIGDLVTLERLASEHLALAVYFSAPDCNVCKVLKPRLMEALELEFPRVQRAEVDVQGARELAAQLQIFSIPTLIILFDGRESQRWVRNIALGEVRREISRPYQMLFSGEE